MSMIRPATPPPPSQLESIPGMGGQYESTKPEILWERTGSTRISRYIKKRSSLEIYETDSSITLFNQSISELYAYAFNGAMSTNLSPNRVRLEVNEEYRNMICRPLRTYYTTGHAPMSAWEQSNAYCYEQVTGPSNFKERRQQMIQDLNACFRRYRLVGHCQVLPVRALALIKTTTDPIQSRAPKPKIQKREDRLRLHAISTRQFVTHINLMHPASKLPIIDNTGIEYLLDLDLSGDLEDMSVVNQQIAGHGLQFKEMVAPCPMLTIKTY